MNCCGGDGDGTARDRSLRLESTWVPSRKDEGGPIAQLPRFVSIRNSVGGRGSRHHFASSEESFPSQLCVINSPRDDVAEMEKLKRVFARGAKGEKAASKFSMLRGASQGTAPTGHSASGPSSASSAPPSSSTPASALHGLDVLHAWNSPAVDICFVHGLGGDRYNTWAAAGASAPW